jgi:AcrR family transcriptional regulator
MGARAESTQATADRVLDVAAKLFAERAYEDISIAAVAEGAGVTQRTVIRRFGTKEALFYAANQRAGEAEMRARHEVPVGDIEGAVDAVLASYERFGGNRLRVLAQEDRLPILAEDAEAGRLVHRQWVQTTFEPLLKDLGRAEQRRRTAALIALTDVYMWKLLRRDLGLSTEDVKKILVGLITGLEGKPS